MLWLELQELYFLEGTPKSQNVIATRVLCSYLPVVFHVSRKELRKNIFGGGSVLTDDLNLKSSSRSMTVRAASFRYSRLCVVT